MNTIRCLVCGDILIPHECAGVRVCACGNIQMRAVPRAEIGHNNLVEVKIFSMWHTNSIGNMEKNDTVKQVLIPGIYHLYAQVVKIHNYYLSGELKSNEFTETDRDTNSLFFQNKSHIVITDIITPGVKIVKEWSNPKYKTSAQYIKWIQKKKGEQE